MLKVSHQVISEAPRCPLRYPHLYPLWYTHLYPHPYPLRYPHRYSTGTLLDTVSVRVRLLSTELKLVRYRGGVA